jgi:hypothetical protein
MLPHQASSSMLVAWVSRQEQGALLQHKILAAWLQTHIQLALQQMAVDLELQQGGSRALQARCHNSSSSRLQQGSLVSSGLAWDSSPSSKRLAKQGQLLSHSSHYAAQPQLAELHSVPSRSSSLQAAPAAARQQERRHSGQQGSSSSSRLTKLQVAGLSTTGSRGRHVHALLMRWLMACCLPARMHQHHQQG